MEDNYMNSNLPNENQFNSNISQINDMPIGANNYDNPFSPSEVDIYKATKARSKGKYKTPILVTCLLSLLAVTIALASLYIGAKEKNNHTSNTFYTKDTVIDKYEIRNPESKEQDVNIPDTVTDGFVSIHYTSLHDNDRSNKKNNFKTYLIFDSAIDAEKFYHHLSTQSIITTRSHTINIDLDNFYTIKNNLIIYDMSNMTKSTINRPHPASPDPIYFYDEEYCD